MKKWLLILCMMIGFGAQAQWITLTDLAFKNKLQTICPACISGMQLDTTCPGLLAITNLDLLLVNTQNIYGIQFFDNLQTLKVTGLTTEPLFPPAITDLELKITYVDSLVQFPSSLQKLTIRQNSMLKYISGLPQSLKELNCFINPLLTEITAFGDSLKIIDVRRSQLLSSLPAFPLMVDSIDVDSNNLSSLPPLPPALINLECGWNHLSSLPAIPVTLKRLACSNNGTISNLPALPLTLTELDCGYNQISTIPALPDLIKLQCGYNQLTSLPALSNTLLTLHCSNNQLSSLPALPSTLYDLDCSNNQLTSLPPLPNSLYYFGCNFNQLTSLPPLPPALAPQFGCQYNKLTSLPVIPPNIVTVYVDHNELTTLPVFPNSVFYIEASNNLITSLPLFSNYVTDLSINDNLLTSLPTLPNSITTLWARNNLISSMTNIPTGMISMDIRSNQLSTLPPLPNGIISVNCTYNQMTSIPVLPPSLKILSCSHNLLESLPVLNNSLEWLLCDSNKFTSLPQLPNSLIKLYCSDNQITKLPSLTPSLQNLEINNNPLLDCLPLIPNTLTTLNRNNTLISCIPNAGYNNNLFGLPLCGNGSFCEPKPLMSGKVYFDINNNLLYDAGIDSLIPNWTVSNSSGWVATTDVNGQYQIKLDSGVVNTVHLNPQIIYSTITPASYTLTPLAAGNQGSNFDFAVHPIPNIQDLTINIASGTARPGFDNWVTANVNNVGTVGVNNATCKVLLPAGFAFNDATPPITGQNGDTLIWNNVNMNILEQKGFEVAYTVDASLVIGSPYSVYAWIEPSATDTTPANNYTEYAEIIHGGMDPNDKAVADTITYLNGLDKELLYTIRFQNTGNDTAFNIVLRDELSENLDLGTFRKVGASHGNHFLIRDKGLLEVFFTNIQLPDSNINEPESHGFFQYAVKPKANLILGDSINNKADIYFDYNVPVATNTVHNVVHCNLAVPVINSNSPVCAGDSLIFGTDAGMMSYSWTGPNGYVFNQPDDFLAGVTPQAQGIYTVVISDAVGCTNAATALFIIKEPSASTIDTSSCSASVSINGQTYTATGTYLQTLTNAAGCDSVITIYVNLLQPSSNTIVDSACDMYSLNGTTYTGSGIYTQNFTNAIGCDSILTLDLTIKQSNMSTINQSACISYTLNGQTYTSSGNYTQIFTNAAGCDSTILLNLTINQPSDSIITDMACDSYVLNGQTYTSTGIYTQVMPNATGCDSTITLNLTINQSSGDTITQTACNTITINAQTYDTSGIYTQLFTNAVGCDSVLTLYLTINQSTADTITQTACNVYTLNGQTYNASGVYTQMFINGAGCDSTLTLNLTINTVNTAVMQAGPVLSAVANGAVYQWLSCNPYQEMAGETNQQFTATANGEYALSISQNGCSDTSACIPVIGIGLNDRELTNSVILFPNPVTDNLHIKYNLTTNKNATVQLIDMLGRLLTEISLHVNANLVIFPTNGLQPGVYTYKFLNGDRTIQSGKLIIQ
ncbi:MAG: T9SS type A sorting domain-containing protein [Chitinophagaceae bacterium]|nr:T9SS type A sorting domain-containing protein [Chitinophagaceae bacterium]